MLKKNNAFDLKGITQALNSDMGQLFSSTVSKSSPNLSKPDERSPSSSKPDENVSQQTATPPPRQTEIVPAYYAWFSGSDTSTPLINLMETLGEACARELNLTGTTAGTQSLASKDIRDPSDNQTAPANDTASPPNCRPCYYSRQGFAVGSEDRLHCTAFYFGSDSAKEQAYLDDITEYNALGRAYSLKSTMIVATDKTLGLAVTLDEEELNVFQNNRPDAGPYISSHVTLGTAEEVSAVATGADILKALELRDLNVPDKTMFVREMVADDAMLSNDVLEGRVLIYKDDNMIIVLLGDSELEWPTVFSRNDNAIP